MLRELRANLEHQDLTVHPGTPINLTLITVTEHFIYVMKKQDFRRYEVEQSPVAKNNPTCQFEPGKDLNP